MADDLLQNYCPMYQNELGKLVLRMEYVEDKKERNKLLKAFCGKHFVPAQFLQKLINSNGKRYFKQWTNVPEKTDTASILQHYFRKNDYLDKCSDIYLSLLHKSTHYEKTMKAVEDAFSFPHRSIQSFYEEYKKYGAKPLSEQLKKSYEKSLTLWKKIQKAGGNDEKWLECIKKVENKEAVVAYIEQRLKEKSSCSDKQIWKYYVKYLRNQNCLKELLEVYLRYCRFFLSDNEMCEEYRNEIERIGKLREVGVTLFWIDTIEWELDYGNLEKAYALLKKAVSAVMNKSGIPTLTSKEEFIKVLNQNKEKMERYESKRRLSATSKDEEEDYETPAKRRRIINSKLSCYYTKPKSSSRLAVPSFMATYITKSACAKLLSKLHQSSKYFFSLHPIPVCHRLVIEKSVKPRYFQQSLFLRDAEMQFLGNQKLYLSNSLFICSSDVTTLISKIYKCDATHITICRQTLTFKQFEFLISSGKVKSFECNDVTVINENGSLAEKEIENMFHRFGNKGLYFRRQHWNPANLVCQEHSERF